MALMCLTVNASLVRCNVLPRWVALAPFLLNAMHVLVSSTVIHAFPVVLQVHTILLRTRRVRHAMRHVYNHVPIPVAPPAIDALMHVFELGNVSSIAPHCITSIAMVTVSLVMGRAVQAVLGQVQATVLAHAKAIK